MFFPATAIVPTAATLVPVARLDDRLVTVGGSGSSAQVERHPSAAGSVAGGATLDSPIGGAAASREGHRAPLAHRPTGPAPMRIDESTTDPTLSTACSAEVPGASWRTAPRRGALTVTRTPGASTRPGGR